MYNSGGPCGIWLSYWLQGGVFWETCCFKRYWAEITTAGSAVCRSSCFTGSQTVVGTPAYLYTMHGNVEAALTPLQPETRSGGQITWS